MRDIPTRYNGSGRIIPDALIKRYGILKRIRVGISLAVIDGENQRLYLRALLRNYGININGYVAVPQL